jgi:hypothetical protein
VEVEWKEVQEHTGERERGITKYKMLYGNIITDEKFKIHFIGRKKCITVEAAIYGGDNKQI